MKQSQGRRIIARLKQRPHTYLEMMMLGISTCPWKRVREALREGEILQRGMRGDLITWHIARCR